MKKYQKNATSATMPGLPVSVSIAMAELPGDVQEGLLALGCGHRAGGDGGDDDR